MEVQKTYPNQFKALEDLSFTVPKNQIFCLLGPNGSGKSTAFDVITGEVPRTSGDINLKGYSLPKQGGSSPAFNRAGVCFQTNTLFDYMTVEQHLRVCAELKGISKEETAEITSFLLTSLYMTGDAHKKAYTLSGGTKRKLCVTIALMTAPELIFLDEPSTAMDPLTRRRLWMLVKGIMKESGGSTIITTHFMQEAEQVADKVGKRF